MVIICSALTISTLTSLYLVEQGKSKYKLQLFDITTKLFNFHVLERLDILNDLTWELGQALPSLPEATDASLSKVAEMQKIHQTLPFVRSVSLFDSKNAVYRMPSPCNEFSSELSYNYRSQEYLYFSKNLSSSPDESRCLLVEIDVNHMFRQLVEAQPELNFILTDQYGVVIYNSSEEIKAVSSSPLVEQISDRILQNDVVSGVMEEPIDYADQAFDYFYIARAYQPFVLLAGDKAAVSTTALPHIQSFILASAGVLLVLVMFYFYKLHRFVLIPLKAIESNAQSGKRTASIDPPSFAEIERMQEMVSHVKNYDDERLRLYEEISFLKDELYHKQHTKSEFLANMNHELRTPLNAIIGYAEIIKRGVFGSLYNERYKEYVDNIHTSGSNLLNMVNDLLEVARFDANAVHLQEEKLNPEQSLSQALNILQTRIQSGNIRITKHVNTKGCLLKADPLRFKQILVHLLSNAIKFSDSGQSVEVSMHLENKGLAFVVSDHGIGMTHAFISRATRRFEQSDNSFTRKKEGAGVGLWLTRKLVELHQGSLFIDSEEGRGTTVTVLFPAPRLVNPQSKQHTSKNFATT